MPGISLNTESGDVKLYIGDLFASGGAILGPGLGGIVSSESPAQPGLSVGRLFSLSGFENSELAGRYAGVVRMIYFREISGGQSTLKMPFHVGGSLEAGNVWHDFGDIGFGSLLSAGSLLNNP